MTPPGEAAAAACDGPDRLDRLDWIDIAARARLVHFAASLHRWQAAHNLVSASTLRHLWTRHIADSLQLVPYRPAGARRWVDLGSGGGFPGLVIALALGDSVDMTLVESNRKKAAFLRQAARETGVDVTVVADRIEGAADRLATPFEVVSARALAPLAELLALAHPLTGSASRLLLLKSQDYVSEAGIASQSWDFDLLSYPSMTDPRGRVIVIDHLKPKAPAKTGSNLRRSAR